MTRGVTNEDVVDSWIAGVPREGLSETLLTDGKVLLSFGKVIGITTPKPIDVSIDRVKTKAVGNFTKRKMYCVFHWEKQPGEFVTQATSKHVMLAKRARATMMTPKDLDRYRRDNE